MFGKKIHLFSVFGFDVSIDISWMLLAILIMWSLATGLFPYYFKGLSTTTYWWMGMIGATGLFLSIVFHELSHSLIARRFGLPMKGITLFIFGGVAEMDDEPSSPKAEFLMAIAGPIFSMLLGVGAYGIGRLGTRAGWPVPVTGVLLYLGWLNLILAAFNLIPAFPLDGGRVLRSILWRVRGDLRWATHIASVCGSIFGLFLIVLGVISFIGGAFVSGIWYGLIGLFIRSASQMSYRQLLTRDALSGEEVQRFMHDAPVTVPSATSIADLVNSYIYRYHYKMFPVSNGQGLLGCVTSDQVRSVPKDEWERHAVQELVVPCSPDNAVSPHTDAMEALSLMSRTGNSRLLVVDHKNLLGIITLKDMLKFLSLKIDLEGE